MGSNSQKYWKQFWSDKNDPLHSANSDAYYDKLAAELKLLLAEGYNSFLDVGCGNGVLYKRLGLDKVEYVGIDLSAKMVQQFKSRYPAADVRVGDMHELPREKGFDLIFSHGVVQFASPKEFGNMLSASKDLLAPGGRILHAGILWDKLRSIPESGVLQQRPLPFAKRFVSASLVRLGIRQGMGYWYSMRTVRRQASALGLKVEFFGSVLYPYRFHALFSRQEEI